MWCDESRISFQETRSPSGWHQTLAFFFSQHKIGEMPISWESINSIFYSQSRRGISPFLLVWLHKNNAGDPCVLKHLVGCLVCPLRFRSRCCSPFCQPYWLGDVVIRGCPRGSSLLAEGRNTEPFCQTDFSDCPTSGLSCPAVMFNP